jgi:site-specific DNA-methyltransferase (adenine-specific)
MTAPYATGTAFTLFHADAFALLAELAADSAGLALTDPPYSARTHNGARTLAGGGDPRKLIHFAPFSEEDLRRVVVECGRICPRWTLTFCDWRHIGALDVLPPPGLSFDCFGIWNKPNGAPAFDGRGPVPGWEALAILHRSGLTRRWNGGGRRGVFTCNVEHGEHPTTKPQTLLRELVTLFSEPGDLVVDPFCGGGSVGVAALATGRRALLVEQEEHWCEVAARRLEAAERQGSLFAPAELAKPRQVALGLDAHRPRHAPDSQNPISPDSANSNV